MYNFIKSLKVHFVIKQCNCNLRRLIWFCTYCQSDARLIWVGYLESIINYSLIQHSKYRFWVTMTYVWLRNKKMYNYCLLPISGGLTMIWKLVTVSVLKSRTPVACQTRQTRLFLKKQSDQGLPCLLLWQPFCEFQLCKPTFWELKEKSVRNFITFTVPPLIERLDHELKDGNFFGLVWFDSLR